MPFTPRLVDFGLAQSTIVAESEQSLGMRVGTPGYMAPEQHDRRIGDVGPSADLFALGNVLLELLHGILPDGGQSLSVSVDQSAVQPQRPQNDLSDKLKNGLEAIALKCFNVRPALRFATAREVSEALTRLLQG